MAKRKGFSSSERREAVRLLHGGMTFKAVSSRMGCSVAALQIWKRRSESDGDSEWSSLDDGDVEMSDAAVLEGGISSEGVVDIEVPEDSVVESKPRIPFDKFVRKFWRDRAVDVILMEPSVGSSLVSHVNDALRYGYDSFEGDTAVYVR